MKNMLWTAVAKLFLVGSKESENNKTASWVLSSFAKCLQGVFSEDSKKWHVWRTQLENAPLRDNELSTSSTQRRRLFFNAYWNDLQTSQPLHIVYLLIPEVLFSNIIHNKKDLGRDKSLTWHQKIWSQRQRMPFPKHHFHRRRFQHMPCSTRSSRAGNWKWRASASTSRLAPCQVSSTAKCAASNLLDNVNQWNIQI